MLTPSKPPDLEPLRNSFANNEPEADLRQIAIDLFTENMRSQERHLNVYGMPHLGPFQLLERVVTGDGPCQYRVVPVHSPASLWLEHLWLVSDHVEQTGAALSPVGAIVF